MRQPSKFLMMVVVHTCGELGKCSLNNCTHLNKRESRLTLNARNKIRAHFVSHFLWPPCLAYFSPVLTNLAIIWHAVLRLIERASTQAIKSSFLLLSIDEFFSIHIVYMLTRHCEILCKWLCNSCNCMSWLDDVSLTMQSTKSKTTIKVRSQTRSCAARRPGGRFFCPDAGRKNSWFSCSLTCSEWRRG